MYPVFWITCNHMLFSVMFIALNAVCTICFEIAYPNQKNKYSFSVYY